MNDRSGSKVEAEEAEEAEKATVEPGYAGRPRDAQLEYRAILANASIGIAFTRDRRFTLCNPKFAEMFGWKAEELVGQPGEAVFPTRESYEAMASIAIPLLGEGRQLDVEWEMRRRDGTTFHCRAIARAVDPAEPQRATVWIVEDIAQRKRAEVELQRVLSEQRALNDNVVVGIAFVRDRTIARCNRRFEELFGYDAGEPVGVSTRRFYFSDEEFECRASSYEELDAGRTHVREQYLRRKDGSGFWCRISGRALEAGKPAKGYAWLFEDITERRRADEEVRRLAEEQRQILDNATVGIAFVRASVIQRCNRFLEQMVGAAHGALLGQSSGVLFASRGDWEQAVGRAHGETAPGGTHDVEWRFKRADGSTFLCRTRGRRIDDGKGEQEWIWSFEDVTLAREARESLEASRAELERAVAKRTAELEAEIAERRLAESRARHLADHDVLTGLPNRRLLEDRLTQALALSQRNREQTAVMFVDLDRFKSINDQLGHSAGDAVLKEVAERLAKLLREVDTICRIGGDEFVVVLPEIKRSSDAAHVAAKILEMVSQPFSVAERELNITPSVGISVFPDDGRDAETLIRNADAAMYHAKGTGRANYQFFTEQMNQAAATRLLVENELRRAVRSGEMRAYYQPVLEAASGRLASHEALLRWQHPGRGVLGPAEFIQVAEDTGLVLPLGEWILAEACRWAKQGAGLPVSVNLSARQFNDPRLAELVARVLAQTGLAPQLLELEVAEAVAMQQPDVALSTLKKLKELGVILVLDDFGIGLSGVAHLSRVPVDRVKIDRSLIAGSPGSADRHPVVPALVGLGHALGLKVVAKGVETEAQRKMLIACGCDYLQGFLTGAPAEA